MRVQMESFWYF